MRAACASRTRSSFRTRCATQFSTSSPRKAPRRARCSLEAALSAIATSAAYDLSLEEDGTFKAPMLWHYQAVDAHVDGTISRSHWPDHSLGREYVLVRVLVGEERPGRPYADEAEFNRLPPSRAKHALGELPLLVRIQYMNQCHVLNGAAAMALVRHAERCHVRWTVGGREVADIGWQWGDAPDGIGLCVNEVGTQRVKYQAHAHQLATITLGPGKAEDRPDEEGSVARTYEARGAAAAESEYILDLSAAQFGLSAQLKATAGAVDSSLGCAHSPTLAQRYAAGIAPGLFAPRSSPEAKAVLGRCRLHRSQRAVEEALSLVNAAGRAVRPGFPTCGHMMPSPWFGDNRRAEGYPEPDDDLVEGELLARMRKFECILAWRGL